MCLRKFPTALSTKSKGSTAWSSISLPSPRERLSGNEPLAHHSPQHQRGIFRSEGDAVANGMLDILLAAALGNVVKITFRTGLFQSDGRRDLAVLHGDDRRRDSRGAAGALRVPNLRLQCGHGNTRGSLA